jgi:hypothetical protein
MGHRASKSKHNGTIGTLTSARSRRKKAAKRANAAAGRAAEPQRAINHVTEPGHAA